MEKGDKNETLLKRMSGIKLENLWDDECWDEEKRRRIVKELETLVDDEEWKEAQSGRKCVMLLRALGKVAVVVLGMIIYHFYIHSGGFIGE